MNRTYRVVAGVQIPLSEFEEQFDDTYEFEKMDNDLLAFDGHEFGHSVVIVGKPIATFTKHQSGKALHSIDLREKYGKCRQSVNNQLAEVGIHRAPSLYTVSEYR